MYAVAVGDPGQAVKLALKAAGGEAAVANGMIDDASMKTLELKSDEVLKILNDESDPVTTGTAPLGRGFMNKVSRSLKTGQSYELTELRPTIYQFNECDCLCRRVEVS